MFRDMTRAIARAESWAKAIGEAMCVVEVDDEEGRIILVVSEAYTRSDEFEAFCGEILYVTGQ